MILLNAHAKGFRKVSIQINTPSSLSSRSPLNEEETISMPVKAAIHDEAAAATAITRILSPIVTRTAGSSTEISAITKTP